MRSRLKQRLPTFPAVDRYVIGGVVALFVVIALIVSGSAYYMDVQRKSQNIRVDVIFNSHYFSIPRMWFLGKAPTQNEDLDRLELVVPLPSNPQAQSVESEGRFENIVIMRIVSIDQSVPPMERYNQLYARFLSSYVWTNPGGLQLRQFEAKTPYEGEELYISPPDGRDFTARCPLQAAQKSAGGLCMWEVRTQGVDVIVSFSPSRLTDWEMIVSTVLETMKDINKRSAI
jgi:hypothetical protein